MTNRRIWIFQSDSLLTNEEVKHLNTQLSNFISQWFSHGNKLSAEASVEKNLFIIFKLDEAFFQASGCSIDKMNHFVLDMGKAIGKDFFNRQLIAIEQSDKINLVHLNDLQSLVSKGVISSNTLMCDHLIQNEQELEDAWIKPIDKSWAIRFISNV